MSGWSAIRKLSRNGLGEQRRSPRSRLLASNVESTPRDHFLNLDCGSHAAVALPGLLGVVRNVLSRGLQTKGGVFDCFRWNIFYPEAIGFVGCTLPPPSPAARIPWRCGHGKSDEVN